MKKFGFLSEPLSLGDLVAMAVLQFLPRSHKDSKKHKANQVCSGENIHIDELSNNNCESHIVN